MASQPDKPGERASFSDRFLIGLFSLILGIILVAVIFRYVLNQSLSWSDEVVRYLFVWFTLLGAALALRDRNHIRVEYFVERLPAGVRRGVEWASLLLLTLFNLALVVLGLAWVWETRGTSTPALRLPLNIIFYAALPVTAALNVWFCWRRLRTGQYAELESGKNDEVID